MTMWSHRLAIGAGIAIGLGFGQSTLAALITRGCHEMAALTEALGGRAETLSGLSGKPPAPQPRPHPPLRCRSSKLEAGAEPTARNRFGRDAAERCSVDQRCVCYRCICRVFNAAHCADSIAPRAQRQTYATTQTQRAGIDTPRAGSRATMTHTHTQDQLPLAGPL